MSFKSEKMSVSKAFSKNGKSQYTQRPKDRLVEIVDYNLGAATIIAREVDTNRDLEIVVAPDRVAALRQRPKPVGPTTEGWVGWLIDEAMATKLPAGSRIVIEGSETTGAPITRAGKQVSQVQCKWISSVSDPSPEKTFRGVFTASMWNNRINSVQAWDEKALDVSANQAAIYDYLDDLDKIVGIHAAFEAKTSKERPVGRGIQLRAIVPKDKDKDGNTTYETIDTTSAFYWVATEKDSAGNVIKKGHPLDKETAVGLIEGYLGYLSEQFPPEVPYQVEVMTFREFSASMQSKAMVVNDNSPISRLVTTPTKCAQDDTDSIVGKNWAVDGIIALTKDVPPKTKEAGNQWETRNLVQALYANGFTGHVASLVKASDGGRVKIHPALDRPRLETPRANAPAAATGGAASSAPTGLSAPAADPFAAPDADNPFATAMNAGAAAPAPVAEAPAPAPVAAPAAAPAEPSRPSFARPRQPL